MSGITRMKKMQYNTKRVMITQTYILIEANQHCYDAEGKRERQRENRRTRKKWSGTITRQFMNF